MLSSDIKNLPVVVIGAGSIGERHIRNLWQLGFKNIIVYRQRNLPFRDIGDAAIKVVLNWDEVVALNIHAAIICTPTAQHLPQVQDCINAGMHVLVEKPLWHRLFNKEELKAAVQEKNVLLQVGYMIHYHPLLQQVKNYIQQKTYGNILSIQTYWGEYLPAWHSWEDYRNSYAAKKEEGGGAALTLSHDIDLANWLMNSELKNYQSLSNYSSGLEVNTESGFDVNMLYANNATAHVHVNYFQKVPQRWYKIIFDDAVIDINYYSSSMKISTADDASTNTLNHFDRNDMFLDQLTDFFTRIEGDDHKDFSFQQIEDSYNIIKICNNE